MPAITAAANPVNTVSSPTSNAGKAPSSNDSPDRSFSTVLAERTTAQQAPEQTSRKGSDTPSQDQAAKAETADQAAPSSDVATPPVALPFVPADLLRAIAVNSDPAAFGEQAQAVGQIMQTLAQQSGDPEAASVPLDLASAPTTAAALPGAGVESDGITETRVAGQEAPPAAASLTDTQPANATRGKPAEAATKTAASPAKLAADQEQIALPADAKAADKGAAKIEAATAAAYPALAATAALHIPAVAAQNHGGSDIRITTPIGSQHWESAIGNSLVMMTGSGREKAELVLTPPQLGRIEVSIAMKGDEATAIFVSQNPAVRDAIENALPRLRELLADAGITLGQTQVGAESQGQAANDRQNGDNSSRRGSAAAVGSADALPGQGGRDDAYRVTSRSLVDTFA